MFCCLQFMVFFVLIIRGVFNLILARSQVLAQKELSHSHMEFSPVWWLHKTVAQGLTCGAYTWAYMHVGWHPWDNYAQNCTVLYGYTYL